MSPWSWSLCALIVCLVPSHAFQGLSVVRRNAAAPHSVLSISPWRRSARGGSASGCASRRPPRAPRAMSAAGAAPLAAAYEERLQALSSFVPAPYAAPWWARNQHVNTIVGALFVTPQTPPYQRQRFSTPDGDFVDVDFLNSTAGFTRGIVLLYHGLESTTNAPLTVRQAFALVQAGFDVAGLTLSPYLPRHAA